MKVKIRLFGQMGGDHGSHGPGSEPWLPAHVAKQVVKNRHGIALSPMPEFDEADDQPDDQPEGEEPAGFEDLAGEIAETAAKLIEATGGESPEEGPASSDDASLDDWGVDPSTVEPAGKRKRAAR